MIAYLLTILVLLLVALALTGVLWAGAIWLQGWLYETPGGELYWRAPAVGVGLALFYALWIVVDCRTAGHCGSFYKMSFSSIHQYDELKAVTTKNGPEEKFKRIRNADSNSAYLIVGADGQPGTRKLSEAPEKIIIQDGGATMVFEPDRDAKGKFKREEGQNLHYYDKSGRYIDEGNPGQVQQFHWDWLFWNLIFNAVHLGLWFLGLWLLLRFQWAHALGFAVCLWLTMTLFPLPMVLGYAEQAFQVVK